jgi:hypothetical protein
MRVAITLLFTIITACASTQTPRLVPALYATGPWDRVGYNDLDTTISKTCAAVIAPTTPFGNPEDELCGLLYRDGDKGWAASDPLKYRLSEREKPNCRIPDGVKVGIGRNEKVAVFNIVADYHIHAAGDERMGPEDVTGVQDEARKFIPDFTRVLCTRSGKVFTLTAGTWEIRQMIRLSGGGIAWKTIGEAAPPDFTVKLKPGESW